MKIAVLDDYERVARSLAQWESLDAIDDVMVLHEPIADQVELARVLRGREIVCLMRERTPFPRELIERLPELRMISTSGMANAAIDMEAASDHDVVACGTSSLSYPTPELTLGLILSLARGIPSQDAAIRQGRWRIAVGVGLKHKRLGILGLGKNGRQVAQFGTALGMEVVAWSENLTQSQARSCGARLVSKEELFQTGDFITIHLRLSERTHGLVGERELAWMKATAFLINTSRGPIVDQQALLETLQMGRIAGAGLDVFDDEPLPADHPLLSLSNTVLTPHIGYVTTENLAGFYGEAIENIAAYLSGNPIRVLNRGAAARAGG